MGTSLSGLTPQTTFDGLLKVGDNDPLTADLKAISTGDGTDTILSLSNSALQVNGQATIAGTGNNDTTTALLVQNSDGVQLLKMVNDGSSILGNDTHNVNIESNGYVNINSNRVYSTGSRFYYNDGNGYIARLDAAGFQVGNGASAAAATIHAKGSGATSATTSLLVQNSAGTNMFKVVDDNTMFYHTHRFRSAGGYLYIECEANADYSLKIGPNLTASSYGGHIFKTYDGTAFSEVMRITGNTDQFVGIGETTPTAKLHIKGDGTGTADYSFRVQNAIGNNNMQIRDDGAVFLTNNRYTFNATGGAVLKGSGATSATTALLVQNSAGSELLKVRDDGLVHTKSFGFGVGSNYTFSNYKMMVGSTVGPDSGVKFQVKGSGNDATTTALLVQNSDGLDMVKVTDDSELNLNFAGQTNNPMTLRGSGSQSHFIDGGNDLTLGYSFVKVSNSAHFAYGNSSKSVGVGTSSIASSTKMHIKGGGATSATTALLVQNSAGTDLLKVADDGVVSVLNGDLSIPSFKQIYGGSTTYGIYLQGTTAMQFTSWAKNFDFVTQNGKVFQIKNDASTIIGGGTHDASAKLQVDSTTQGFLPPRMTTAQRDAITTPAAGLMIYNTDTNTAECWNGTAWMPMF